MNKVVMSMLGILAAMLVAVDPAYAAEPAKESRTTVESEAETEKSTKSTAAPTSKPAEKQTKGSGKETSKETETVTLDVVEDFDLAFTPDGNMKLVDDFVTSSGKQFMTVMTKAGNTFYIIIDRDANGEKNVHFLNQVDERDLMSLIDEEEASEIASSIEADRESREEAKSTEAPSETKAQEDKTAEEGDQMKRILTIAIPIAAAVVIAIMFFMKKRKNGSPTGSTQDEPRDEEDDEYEI